MAISSEFEQAVRDENKLRIRIMLKDSLLIDKSFRLFDEMQAYAMAQGVSPWADADVPLEKAEKPFFEIHISHGGRAVFVEMINSCEIKEGNILKTKKADRSQHGIGTVNMRDIVKQNGGEITWHYEEGKMHVTISLLI